MTLLADIKSTLEWYQEAGVDEAIEPMPVPRKAAAKPQAINHPEMETLKQAAQSPSKPSVRPPALQASPSEGLSEAIALAAKSASLPELKQAVESFHGLSIRRTAQNTVFADGNPQSEIMLIGEAPGADEDRNGIPFCGASGQLLDQMLSCIGLLRPENFYITNTVFWRPPGNRKPTPEELALCKPFVEKHIALLKPKLILLIGATAVTSIMETNTGISKIRGKIMEYKNPLLSESIPTRAVFHPSYLLRSPGQKKVMWKDLLEIDSYLEKQKIKR